MCKLVLGQLDVCSINVCDSVQKLLSFSNDQIFSLNLTFPDVSQFPRIFENILGIIN